MSQTPAIERVAAGMRIDSYAKPTSPAHLTIERPTRFATTRTPERLGEATLVLREGRHHQVRRIFRALGAAVVMLHRDRVGSLALPPDLGPGKFVEIEVYELGIFRPCETESRYSMGDRRGDPPATHSQTPQNATGHDLE
jgi:16S rRNA U516 pseudouridylate synthase RsuA-like enzyme